MVSTNDIEASLTFDYKPLLVIELGCNHTYCYVRRSNAIESIHVIRYPNRSIDFPLVLSNKHRGQYLSLLQEHAKHLLSIRVSTWLLAHIILTWQSFCFTFDIFTPGVKQKVVFLLFQNHS